MILGTRKEQEKSLKEMAIIAQATNNRECKKCFGRGYSGWSEKLNQYIPCNCITKATDKIRLNNFRNKQFVEELANGFGIKKTA